MGQYFLTANTSKKEFLSPHNCGGQGAKLMEFGLSSHGLLSCLAILLADGNGRGGGDLQCPDPDPLGIVGRWAGDKIVVTGDYADPGKFISAKDCVGLTDEDGTPIRKSKSNLYAVASYAFKDISYEALFTLMFDGYATETILDPANHPMNSALELSLIHKHYPNDLMLLVGKLKTEEGKRIFEQLMQKK